jgi:phage gp29-like protein
MINTIYSSVIPSAPLLTSELVTRDNYLTFHKYIGMLPNPNQVIAEQGNISKAFSNLKNDPHVWSCIQSRKTGVLALNKNIASSKIDGDILSFIQNIFEEFDLFNITSQILEAIFTGFQVMEIIWEETINSKLKPVDIIPKPLDWFFYDNNNQLKFRKNGASEGVSLPENKFLIVRHNPSFENPYGEALLAQCFWAVTTKNMGFRFWMNFLEKYGMPLVIGQYSYPPTAEELQNLSTRLQQLIDSQTIATPSDISIDIKDLGSSKSVELYSQLIKMANSEISKVLLSETLTTEMDSGSYAASITHFKIREEVVLGDVKLVERAYNDLIQMIIKVNYPNVKLNNSDFPKFKFILHHSSQPSNL